MNGIEQRKRWQHPVGIATAIKPSHCRSSTAEIKARLPHVKIRLATETQCTQLAATLTLVAVCLVAVVDAKNGFTVGQRQPNDEEIEATMEAGRGPPDYVLSYSKTYVGDNHRVITQIVVEDTANGGAYVAIVAGGPGYTYATLAYAIPRYVEMNYEVRIYGKIPAFRKIP